MYLDPSVSINCKYKIMNNIRLDPLTVAISLDFLFKVMILANFGLKVTNFLRFPLLK